MTPSTPLQLLRSNANRDAPAIVEAQIEERISWVRWSEIVDHLGRFLLARGVGPGDLVAHLGTNHPVLWSTALAAWSVGADFWPINYRWSSGELQRSFSLLPAPPKILLADEEFRRLFDGLPPTLHPEELISREEFWQSAVSGSADSVSEPTSSAKSDGRLLMSTGGTTGGPRLVALRATQLGWNARSFAEMTGLTEEDRILVCAPNFHVAGFSALTLAAFTCSSSLVFAPRFDPAELVSIIEDKDITATLMVPTMWRALFDEAHRSERGLRGLRFGICGGAPMPPQLIDEASDLGFELLQGYGMTEAGPMVTLMPPGALSSISSDRDTKKLRASSGVAPEGIELQIVDAFRRVLPAGEIGQIAISGPNLVDRYLGQSSSQSFADGWFYSGDQGHLDEDGFLFVHGRLDDIIITGGENVAPAEVESALMVNADVARAAVFGIPDDYWGERVVALVVPARKTFTDSEELLASLKPDLAGFKIPRELRFVPELPLTPAGKISRSSLLDLWYKS